MTSKETPAAEDTRGPFAEFNKAGWEKECQDTDKLLEHLGLDPAVCRTDGGSLNLARVKALREKLDAEDKCLACGGRGFHDFGHGDYRDCPDCADGKPGCDFCNHPLYTGRKCKNCGRVDESFDGKAVEPVAKIVRNEAGQIRLIDANGDAFDMSKHIGAQFYTTPPTPAVPDGFVSVNTVNHAERKFLEEVLPTINEEKYPNMVAKIRAMLSAAPQPEKAG